MIRTIIIIGLVLFGAVRWLGAPLYAFYMMGEVKTEMAHALEDAGIDAGRCKAKASIFDPTRGLNGCMQDVYKEVERSIDEGAYTPSENEEPPLD